MSAYRGTRLIERIAWRLRCLADQIDDKHAVRSIGYSFRWDPKVKAYVMSHGSDGCSIYIYEGDYERAWK